MSGQWRFPVNPHALTDEPFRREFTEACRLRADEAPNGQRIPRDRQRLRWVRDDHGTALIVHRRAHPEAVRNSVWVQADGDFCYRMVVPRSALADHSRWQIMPRLRDAARMWGFTGRLSLRLYTPTGPPGAELIEVRIHPYAERLP